MEVEVDHCERSTVTHGVLTRHRAARHAHRSERGFTLIELLVASAITGVIALTLGAAIALSIRLVGPQGAEGQQVASNSELAVERQLSTDVSHAECVITAGSCPGAVAPLTAACSPGFSVCVVWCEVGSPQAATYSVSGSELVRQDAQGTLVVAREITSLSFDATIPVNSSSPQLQVDLVAGTSRRQHATFTARSLVTGASPLC